MPVKKGTDGRWRYRQVVRLPNGARKRISGSAPNYCNTKAAAHQAMLDHIERLRNPERAHKDREVPRFDDFSTEFIENYVKVNNKRNTVIARRSALNHHLLPAFGEMGLDEIGLRDIEAYKAEKLATGLSWRSINFHLETLLRVLSIAKEWEVIDVVPKVKTLRGAAPEWDFLDFDEAERVIEAADPEWVPLLVVALKTGMRQGELLALRWENVDLRLGLVIVREAISRGVVGTPKSGKDRKIPLSPQAQRVLEAQRRDGDSSLVFGNAKGGYLKPAECRAPLRDACRAAGLREINFHALRHTFASHLVMRGVPLKVVQELLGHANIQMTMRYAHLTPSMHQDAVVLLDAPEPRTE